MLDRMQLRMLPLSERSNKKDIARDHVTPEQAPRPLNDRGRGFMPELLERIRAARRHGRPVMLAFGAHTIKNGLGPVLIALMEQGWVTHLATNGAGVIHDWEFAFQGRTSEDVRANVARGMFGNWQETGFYLNLAINLGAYQGRGYGEAVGAFIQQQGLDIPATGELEQEAKDMLVTNPHQAAAAADMLGIVKRFSLAPGHMRVEHPHRHYSVQAAAFRLGIPFTSHPMFGHDIIYNHPMNCGSMIGRGAERDFLRFADSVSRLKSGVYLSVGSAVMSPMIFEKSMSMAQNLALQQGRAIQDHLMVVVDLAESTWDWSRGEPPEDTPDYYLRYCKSFSRMGGRMRYLQADNRDFLLTLTQGLSMKREHGVRAGCPSR